MTTQNLNPTQPCSRSIDEQQTHGTPRERLGITDYEFQRMGEVGAMYYRQGDLAKAYTIFKGLVEVDPESCDAHAALGAVLTRTEQNEEALIVLNQAIKLNNNEIAPLVNRAEVLLRQNKVEQAITDLQPAIALDPQEANPAANRARAIVLGIHGMPKTAQGIM